jgi:hypothetical protein
VITVADMMSHIAVQIDSPLSGWLEGKVRSAVLSAWARLMNLHEWSYFHRQGNLLTYAGQTDGTVDFVLSTRRVTLTGDTWPSNVTARHIKLDQNWYPIYRRISDTVIELYEGRHPEDDLDDVTYVCQQVLYPLPQDVGDVVQVLDGTQNITMLRLNLAEAFQIQEGLAWSPVLPNTYALVGDSTNPQRWCLWIPTEQTANSVLHYMYKLRRPNNVLTREDRGTVSVTGGVATFSEEVVTALWSSSNVLLRLSTNDTDMPTSNWGDTSAGDLRYNRDCSEVRVLERLTSTTCRISDTTLELDDVVYVASSLIDTGDATMETLMARLAEDEYGAKPVGNHTEKIVSASRLAVAFNEAKSADARYVRNKGALSYWYGLRLRDLGYISAST